MHDGVRLLALADKKMPWLGQSQGTNDDITAWN